jgi:carboxyl-terminal processing protease
MKPLMTAAALLAAALVGAGVTYAVVHPVAPAGAETSAVPPNVTDNVDFQRLVQVYEDIRTQTIWPNTPRQLWTAAINGMVGSLHDRFSEYLSPAAMRALNQELGASFGGIGVVMDVNSQGQFQVIQVLPGTPAGRAGVQAGDLIVGVDGKSVNGDTADQVAAAVRGKPGTTVTLTLNRDGRVFSVRLRRAEIVVPTVFVKMLPDHVGYMDISEFGYHTGQQVIAGYRRLVAEGARGILLDLRDNPGGDLGQCQLAASVFVPAGPLVRLEYADRAFDQTLDSAGPGTHLPVVVLVNGDTASAAEILSAAIQQRGVGILVGTRTFGKGIVQAIEPLPGGAYLKLTVAKYLTPNGDYIEHKGLTPNIVVPEPPTVEPSDNLAQDPQLARAYHILLGLMAHRTS